MAYLSLSQWNIIESFGRTIVYLTVLPHARVFPLRERFVGIQIQSKLVLAAV